MAPPGTRQQRTTGVQLRCGAVSPWDSVPSDENGGDLHIRSHGGCGTDLRGLSRLSRNRVLRPLATGSWWDGTASRP